MTKPEEHVLMVAEKGFMVLNVTINVRTIVKIQNVNRQMLNVNVKIVIMGSNVKSLAL